MNVQDKAFQLKSLGNNKLQASMNILMYVPTTQILLKQVHSVEYILLCRFISG